jgi:hypothetical protein
MTKTVQKSTACVGLNKRLKLKRMQVRNDSTIYMAGYADDRNLYDCQGDDRYANDRCLSVRHKDDKYANWKHCLAVMTGISKKGTKMTGRHLYGTR